MLDVAYLQGGHSPGEPGKPGKVREFKSGQGKVTEKRKSQGKCVLAYGQLPRVLILTQNVQKGIITRYSCASHEVWKKKGIFCARQHICYSAYMLSPVRPSVCLSVCHTGGSVKNG